MPPELSSPPSKSLPLPVEQSKGSNRQAKGSAAEDNGDSKPSRRALPQPVETSTGSSRPSTQAPDALQSQSSASSRPLPQPMESSASSSKSRRFAPQMVETSRRSRRNTDESVGMPDADRTDNSSTCEDQSSQRASRKRPDLVPCPPGNTPASSSADVPRLPLYSRFCSSRLAKKQPRRHSFRVPDLPSINSSETEEGSNASDVPSSIQTPSAESDLAQRSGSKKRKKTYPPATRESGDERFSGYLLTLAASAAEKQLRDQAMAAYPNENVHEPVDHYAIDRDSEADSDTEIHVGKLAVADSGEENQTSHSRNSQRQRHRDSGAGGDMVEMRSHRAQLEDQRQKAWLSDNAGAPGDAQTGLDPRVRSIQHDIAEPPQPPKSISAWQKDNEGAAMRRAASPPMAGSGLQFVKCLSPRQTRLDVHQSPADPTKSTPRPEREPTGLWTPGSGPGRKSSVSGLWMGVNAASAQPAMQPHTLNSGLLTPAREKTNPFNTMSSSRPSSRATSPSSRRSSRAFKAALAMTSIISSPVAEQPPCGVLPPTPPSSGDSGAQKRQPQPRSPSQTELKKEFPDSFVTQVYNYLSLGYPVLARPYDEELSRITSVDTATLRKDDYATTSAAASKRAYVRGYVGVPEGTGADARGEDSGAGERWKALRLYIWEWGRQQRGIWDGEEMSPKQKEEEGLYERWNGAGANRKGSWGW